MSTLFISYSHKDELWKDRVVTHLGVVARDAMMELWDDRKIAAGADWLPKIEKAIEACDVALLLISADFLTSKFILEDEVPKLLQRLLNEGVRVIPVILRPSAWTKVSWLKSIQARPKDGKPLSSMAKHGIELSLAELAIEVATAAHPSKAAGDLQYSPAASPKLVTMHALGVAPFRADRYAPEFDRHLKAKKASLLGRLNIIRERVEVDLRQIPGDDFNGSAALHAREVACMLARLFPAALASELSEEELFILGVDAVTHDWGMLPRPGYLPERLYREHPEIGARMALALDAIPKKYREAVSLLCEVHNLELSAARARLSWGGAKWKLELLYAMLRLADTLEIRLQSPSLAGGTPATTVKVIGTFNIDTEARTINITQNISLLDERQFRIAVSAATKIVKECNVVLKNYSAEYEVISLI